MNFCEEMEYFNNFSIEESVFYRHLVFKKYYILIYDTYMKTL